MKTTKKLYTAILLWAYEKQHRGFTRPELTKEFNIKGDLGQWVTKMFYTGNTGNPALIGHLISKDGVDYYGLTTHGMSTAIDYIELREARRASFGATIIAILAMAISIIVGVWQIKTTQDVRVTNEIL